MYTAYDTEVTITIPHHCKAYYYSKYKGEIKQFQGTTNRLWVGILNKSFFKDIVIEKGKPLGFFMVELSQQYFAKHEAKK